MKKKVLFLITKSNFGGAQRYVYDLATGLPKTDWEVVVAAGGEGELIDRLKLSEIRVIPIPSLERDISMVKEIQSCKEIADIVRSERPDILHINSSKAGALGALIGRIYGVPRIIFTAHGWSFNENRPGWQKLILKFIHYLTVILSHETIAVAEEVKKQMSWPFAEHKMTVIYNGRNLPALKSREEAREFLATKAPGLSKFIDDTWSMTIAELHPIKRHDLAIKAMKEIARLSPHHRHIIIGSGQEEAHLRRLIKEKELEEQVFLLGNIKDAAQYLRAADVFILTSRSEAMPYVIIEALIAGLPIIATRVGGIKEIIEDQKSGMLIPSGDQTILVKEVVRITTDPSFKARLQTAALERAHYFTFEQTLEKTIACYKGEKTTPV